MVLRHSAKFRVGRRLRALITTASSELPIPPGYGMEIEVSGDQLILSGPIVARDYDEVANTLSLMPEIGVAVRRRGVGPAGRPCCLRKESLRVCRRFLN